MDPSLLEKLVYFQCHWIITKEDVILMPVSFGQDTVACIYIEAHLHIHLHRGAIYIDKGITEEETLYP